MTVESFPLSWPDGWQRTNSSRRQTNAHFNTTFDVARKKLLNEIRLLGGDERTVVISSWLPLRRDGTPLASGARQRMEDPGVAVYFMLKGKQMVMARDGYTSVHDNITSIYHAIAHLRGLERHGGGNMMERAFAGFTALPSPGQANRHWQSILGTPSNWNELTNETQRSWIENRYREVAKTAHPDVEGGSETKWAELQHAKTMALAAIGGRID